MPQLNFGRAARAGSCNRGAVGLQIGHQRLQIAKRHGAGGPADPLLVLLRRQLALVEHPVENPTGVVPVAVFGPGILARVATAMIVEARAAR